MVKLSLSKIVVTPDNPRKAFDEEAIKQIGESILQNTQIHPIIVRSLPDGLYELVTGEMRLRGCMAVGLSEIEADVRDLTDLQCDVLRIKENIDRTDLSYAEKGDQVIRIWSHYDEFGTIKSVSERLGVPYDTVIKNWIPQAKKLSQKLKDEVRTGTNSDGWSFTNKHAHALLKYPHSVQDRIFEAWKANKLPSPIALDFVKAYDADPNVDLDSLAKKVMGLVAVVTYVKREDAPEKPKKNRESQKGKKQNRIGRKTKSWRPASYKQKKPKDNSQVQDNPIAEGVTTIFGDFEIVGSKVASDSVDLIFTDPPYGEEWLEHWEFLGKLAARVLKQGSYLVTYAGHPYLPKILNDLSKNLEYYWMGGVHQTGGEPRIWNNNIWVRWKPLLIFSKGKGAEHDWINDLIEGKEGNKDDHEWAQGESEAAYFIEKLTKPSGVVLDPMMGSGTTLRAALKSKRSSIGIEKDEETFAKVKLIG